MAKLKYEIISMSYPDISYLQMLVRDKGDPIDIHFQTDKIYGRVAVYTFEPNIKEQAHKRMYVSIKINCPQNDMSLETDEIVEMILVEMAEALI